MKEKWFFERLYPAVKIGYKIEKILKTQFSPFQKIEVFTNSTMGRVLTLDNVIQTTERDEFIYHEMLVHIPLISHPDPKKILIIGGGDGGVLREVLKYPVQKVTLVEIDRAVIGVSKKYLQNIGKRCWENKKLELIIDDGAKFVRNTEKKFDVVIVDSSDPIGPAKVLFRKKFYQDIKRILNKKGVMTRQTGSSFYQEKEMKENFRISKEVFKNTFLYLITLPSYIGGFFTLLYSSESINPIKISKALLTKKIQSLGLKTKYYNPDIHISCFSLPEYIKKALKL